MAPNMAEPKPEDAGGPPDRSRRMQVFYAVTLALLVALGAFCWLVVKPVLEARKEILSRLVVQQALIESSPRWFSTTDIKNAELTAIQRLGGPQEASRKLRLFLQMPEWFTESGTHPDYLNRKAGAIMLLGSCGKEAIPTLIGVVKKDDYAYAFYAAVEVLGDFGPEARAAIPVLARLKKGSSDYRDKLIAEALKKIRADKPSPPPGNAPKSE